MRVELNKDQNCRVDGRILIIIFALFSLIQNVYIKYLLLRLIQIIFMNIDANLFLFTYEQIITFVI